MIQKKYKVTVFDANAKGKIPLSPFGDRTFVFRTREITSHFDFLSTIGKYFVLNQPFKLVGEEHDFRDFRRISTLEDKFDETLHYIMLDIDNVHTKESMDKILNYFKDYKVILGESYSHNGIDNFRLKGVLFCEPSTHKQVQNSLETISNDLRAFCNIDTSRGFIPSFNAPSHKNKPILNNELGKLWVPGEKLSLREVPKIELNKLNELKLNDKKEVKPIQDKVWMPKDFDEVNTVPELCVMYFENLGFVAMEPIVHDGEEFVRFRHDTEVKTPGGFFWNKDNPYIMNHWNANRTIDAFLEISKIPRVKELIKDSLDYNSELLSYNPSTKLIKVNDRFLSTNPEIDEVIQDFIESDKGIFSIRSPMGTGKSTIIREIINQAHDYGLRVMIITNRVSVAEDFGEKYNIKLYNDNTAEKYNKGESLICQFDSLWKYDVKDFDLIIMDEFISLMSHSRSELKNSSFNLIKFFASFNKKLVIADAFLTGYERFLLEAAVDRNSYLLDNEYRDNTILFDYECRNQFILKLLHTAREHKITVSSTSLRFLEDVRSLLIDNGIRTMSLTAETPEHTKELIYETFKSNHDKYDVLLYSPTLTVGVSILSDIGYHFHYDGSNSADVISSIQMIKRNRNAKEIHMFIREAFRYLITDYQKLRTQYLNNVGKAGDFSILFEINEYGDVQISEIGKKVLKIDVFKNILETNHRGAMLWLMKYHFKHEPRKITKRFDSNILTKYTRENRENARQLQQDLIQEFLSLNDVDKVEIREEQRLSTTLTKLADTHEELDLKRIGREPDPDGIKEGILNLALQDALFIEKLKYFKLMKDYLEGKLSENDIKYRMQKYIGDSEVEIVKFCSALLKFPIRFSTEYELREEKNRYVRLVINRCGYKKTSKVGHRFLAIPEEIQKYSEFVIGL